MNCTQREWMEEAVRRQSVIEAALATFYVDFAGGVT